MKSKVSLREIQELEFEILKYFVKICNEEKLKYFLVGGTLLGAVRHKGFIPWDDDIDIAMPRPDYMKLIKILSRREDNKIVGIDSMYLGSKNPNIILRLYDKRVNLKFKEFSVENSIGVWIDIHPIDGVPENKYLRKLLFFKEKILLICFNASFTKLGSQRRNKILTYGQYILTPIYFIFKLIGHQYFAKKLEKNSQKYKFEESSLVAVICGRAGEKETMNKDEYMKKEKLLFEGQYFSVPGCYDRYLTCLYCDYMKEPKDKEKESRHKIEVEWKEEEK